MDKIIIYTDGGARGNGKENNVGGFGVYFTYKGNEKEYFEGELNTTNNIQELKAVIKALEMLKTTHLPVEIYSDSAYVVNGLNSWVEGWKKRGWRKADKKPVENVELWKSLDELANKQKDLKLIKIKGHAGHFGNEKADELANKAMDEMEMKVV